ncbi:hypothetical protein AMTR_s00027p00240390 [Amborella trichopoda]|uniref:Integrase zinc-binding domain-containing protein n=1 Tax=Amborella trichopoda TaxID=13333 RepID=W1PS20_AMBTC|nr:hypothetical protein AMTR_s00027p00240390 [Amborella trichopoda]
MNFLLARIHFCPSTPILPKHYGSDSYFSKVIGELPETPNSPYILFNGYLFRGNSLCVPERFLRLQVVAELPKSTTMKHFGQDKTEALVRQRYYWPSLQRDEKSMCKSYCEASGSNVKAL